MVTKLDQFVPIQYRCMAHVGNLIIGTMVKSSPMEATFKKLLLLVDNIDRCTALRNYIASRGGNRVARFIQIRWYSAGNTINSVLLIKDILRADLSEIDGIHYERWSDIAQSDAFWNNLKRLKLYFDKMSQFISLSEWADSKLSDSFRCLLEYSKYLIKEVEDSETFKPVALEAFLKHFVRLDLGLLLMAYALNPNHKLEWLSRKAIDIIKPKLLEVLIWSECDYNLAVLKNELNSYFQWIAANRDEQVFISDVAAWWREQSWTYLSLVGQRMANCHASSANTERIFSALNRIVSPMRNRLSIGTIMDLITVHMSNKSRKKASNRRSHLDIVDLDDEADNVSIEEYFDQDAGSDNITNEDLEVILDSDEFSLFNSLILFDEASFIDSIEPASPSPTPPPKRKSSAEIRAQAQMQANEL